MTRLIFSLGIVFCLEISSAAGASSSSQRPPTTPTPARRTVALQADGLTKEEFKRRLAALSNDDLVQFKGRQMTKAELLRETERRRQRIAQVGQSPGSPKAAAAKLGADLKARLAANNAKAKGQLAGLGVLAGLGCPTPKIDGVVLFSNITPGGFVAVKGCGFGSTQGNGSLFLELTEPPFNNITVKVSEWKDGLVGGQIPSEHQPGAGTTKVLDQNAHFKIQTPKGVATSQSVKFLAAREIKQLPFGSLKVSCSTESDNDSCHADTNFGYTVRGFHSTLFDPFGSDEGTDSYSATLKNGWLFRELDFKDDNWESSHVWSPTGFVVDSPSTSIQVKWDTGCGACDAGYRFSLWIEGPVGTAHQ